MGTIQLMSLKALGFEGSIYPIHPKETGVRGLKAYRNVIDLPEVPDLAVIVLPTNIVPQVLKECGKKGITHAIVVSGGFKEVGGNGADLETEILEIAKRYGMRFLGPNCIGVSNPHHKLNTTFFPDKGSPGFIGLVSQSGSFVTQMFDYLSRLSLGFSTAFSVGNEANLDIVDCMEYLGVCPHTKVIALYIEGINRGRAFFETARAIIPHKPIVALYVGGSEAGKRAGLSHTGALAGPDLLYDGVFRQSGVIRAHSVTELFDFSWVLGGLPTPKGNKVVIQTHSGGPGAAAADSCGKVGLELPALSKKTLEKLTPFVPHTGSINNPVDLTYTKNPLDYFSDIPKALLEENNTDILLMYLLMPLHTVKFSLEHMGFRGDQVIEQTTQLFSTQAESIACLPETYGKPLIGYTFRGLEEQFIRELLKRGVPVFSDPLRSARAIRALVKYADRRKKL